MAHSEEDMMENEIKTNERQQAQALGLLNAKDVVVSVVKVTADGVSIKLWPDADAVRGVLNEVAQLAQVPGGYSLRRYVCGRTAGRRHPGRALPGGLPCAQ